MSKTQIGYVRLSRDDSNTLSIENQIAALRKVNPNMEVFIDRGVSGKTNLTDPNSEWSKNVRPRFLEDPSNTQIVVYTFDRLGRRKGKVLSELEDITAARGSVYVARDKRTFTDAEDIGDSFEMLMRAQGDETYRVEVSKKTQRAMDVLKEAGVPIGRKPKLNNEQIARALDLHKKGLGYTSIGKVLAADQRVIRSVINGTYESREDYDKRAQRARRLLGARNIIAEEHN